MLSSFWRRVASFFPFHSSDSVEAVRPDGPSPEDIQSAMSEEFRGLRKLLRKQSALLEEIRTRQNQTPDTLPKNGLELMRLASAFFHLEQSLNGSTSSSPQRREAVSLFWLQLDGILDREDIRMIRERGVTFDPRLHRAVVAHNPGAQKIVVVEILEPGFIEGGQVRQSAKVILGPEEQETADQQETQEEIEQ